MVNMKKIERKELECYVDAYDSILKLFIETKPNKWIAIYSGWHWLASRRVCSLFVYIKSLSFNSLFKQTVVYRLLN